MTRRRARPHSLAGALAFFLPLVGALTQIRGEALWRSDAAILSALEGQTAFQGAFSHQLSQLALRLPLGSHPFRVALPGAVFAGLAGLSVLYLCHGLFRKQGGYSRLDDWLALGASLSVSFSLPWLSEASVSGGAAIGGGLALLALGWLVSGGLPRTLLSAGLLGCLLGALLTQSLWAAGLVLLVALIVWPEAHSLGLGSKKHVHHVLRISFVALGAAVTAGLLWLPALFEHSLVALTSAAVSSTSAPWPLWSPLDWATSIGFLWTAGALFALLFSLEDRRPLYALGLIIFADFLAPGNGSLGWTSAVDVDQNRIALHLLALALIAILGALGLRTLSESAQALKLFAARPLATMVAVLAIAGCLASAEDSLRRLGQTTTNGTQAITDEALRSLPDNALVLIKTPAWGRRLLAAQALGERPDVLVIPLGDVTRPSTIALWLKNEPSLEILLRDLSVSETPSERALARLVDQRPVALEADPDWDRRLLEHVVPTIPLAEFSSHALGRSDRLAALEGVSAPRDRILRSTQDELTLDQATLVALLKSFEMTEAVLGAVKDGTSKRALGALHPKSDAQEPSEPGASRPLAAL